MMNVQFTQGMIKNDWTILAFRYAKTVGEENVLLKLAKNNAFGIIYQKLKGFLAKR